MTPGSARTYAGQLDQDLDHQGALVAGVQVVAGGHQQEGDGLHPLQLHLGPPPHLIKEQVPCTGIPSRVIPAHTTAEHFCGACMGLSSRSMGIGPPCTAATSVCVQICRCQQQSTTSPRGSRLSWCLAPSQKAEAVCVCREAPPLTSKPCIGRARFLLASSTFSIMAVVCTSQRHEASAAGRRCLAAIGGCKILLSWLAGGG